MAAPIMHDPIRFTELPGATVQLAAAGTIMLIDSAGSGRAKNKK